MTLKLARLALVVCLGLGSYAQTPPVTPPVSADTTTLAFYDSLFRRQARVEIQADRAEASGRDPLHRVRKWLQEQTGLTDQEWAKVHPVLVDAISASNAKLSETESAINRARIDNGVPQGPLTLTTAQKHAIGALRAQREQIVLAHVQQIAMALGPGRFQQFDDAVRQKVIGSSLKIIPIPPKK